MLRFSISGRTFHFRQPAGTSRGVYTTRHSWFITLTDSERSGVAGVGECAPLPDLSCDDIAGYEQTLSSLCSTVVATGTIDEGIWRPYPSMRFGMETAMRSLLGFRCVKLKIGAIDFEQELDLVKRIRQRFSPEVIELRLDANGAFSPQDALKKLDRLSQYHVHSIEQPIRQHQWGEMARLCKNSPIPIALDEELIGVNLPDMKKALLDSIRPSYIILKPSLHGGMLGAEEWIRMAEARNIGSWVTSALESNVGLSAIAQFAAHVYGCPPQMPQGLGTGQLFTDNIESPIMIRGDQLFFLPQNQ